MLKKNVLLPCLLGFVGVGHVPPPPETGLPDGVGPSSVKDPVLRKRFEEAIEQNTRNVNAYQKKRDLEDFEKRFTKSAKRQLVDSYCKPPYRIDELEKTLGKSGVDKQIQVAIVTEVKKRVAARIEQEAKLPNIPPQMVLIELAPPGTSPHQDLVGTFPAREIIAPHNTRLNIRSICHIFDSIPPRPTA